MLATFMYRMGLFMKKKNWLALYGLTFLAGCSSFQNVSNEVLGNDVKVVSSVESVKWNSVTIPSSFSFVFSPKSQLLKMDGFESPVSGFSFQNPGTPIILDVNAPVKDLSVFSPSVNVYDQNMNLIQKYTSDVFGYDRNNFVKGAVLSGEVELSLPASTSVVHVIIYTTKNDLKDTTTIIHPAKAMAISKRNDPPAIDDLIAKHSEYGTLSVSIKTKSTFSLFGESKSPSAPNIPQPVVKAAMVQPETQSYYYKAIEQAVAAGDIPKALSLLDEAKALNIPGAQETFVRAVNQIK
jgi:maltose operon protein